MDKYQRVKQFVYTENEIRSANLDNATEYQHGVITGLRMVIWFMNSIGLDSD